MTRSSSASVARVTATVTAAVCAAGLALGCSLLFGPTIELPKDLAEAAAKPEIGSRALLRAYQTELEIASWQPAVQSLVDALGEGIDPTHAQPLRQAVRRTYGSQRLFDRVATSIAEDWDPDAALAQLQFFRSGIGQKVLHARAIRRQEKTAARFQEFSTGFSESQFPAARVALLRRLDAATLTSKGAVLVNRAVVDGALAALSGTTSGTDQAGFRSLRERAAREEPQLYPMAADEMLRWNLFALQSLSDDELAQYVAFAESSAGQWWVVSQARALRLAANGAGEELFQSLRPRNEL
ncbi:MAG TPA: hypothetical protein VMR86_12475 [Myxococcota bacterium]|nr:hypothetical protein [Myxococcota bacterium]